MVIGFNGQIKSGKNLCAKIFQGLSLGLTPEEIMGVISIKGNQYNTPPPFIEKSFAAKVKDIVAIMIGCERKDLDNQTFKETPLSDAWKRRVVYETTPQGTPINICFVTYPENKDETHDWINKHYNTKHHPHNHFVSVVENLTPRIVLQIIGTDAGRELIHPDIWVNALFSDYNKGDKWVITDLRFPNEAKRIKSYGGLCFTIKRPATDKPNPTHKSETSLRDYKKWDGVITNDNGMLDLIYQIQEIHNQYAITF